MFGIHDLSLFVVSGLLLNIMPGPDSLLIMTRSATQGWRAGSAAALGIGTGTFVHIFAAALGMSAILATSAAAFTVVKLLGAAYILYLAIGMLLSKRAVGSAVQAPALAPLPLRRIYGQGILTNVLNPKVALFFLAFVPQFIDANAPHKALAFIVLGAIFNINGMLWCHALALFTAQARARLKLNPAVTQWLNRATGGLFVWLGVKLALAKQH
ncbi:LysE family translocator [Massilia sp. TW-1]|uniref:LysE family translocator n=1 Tax=Telluria antibiotica TaxID=2717319 RepID=A0ABX0PD36_9BURK|nr:LysE family translocator [Telluria antibiotica]NIA54737.1 LysE family translocator [Telluria antibiotica]